MKINRLHIINFRNISHLQLEANETVNVIYGDNGQGKTNLVEALWLFCGCGSFRGAKERELIQFDKDKCKLEIDFFSQQRQQNAVIQFAPKRKFFLNDVPKKKISDFSGSYFGVVFSPDDMMLLKSAPQQRRLFLDNAIAQISKKHRSYVNDYKKILFQRNSLLKEWNGNLPMLEVWDQYLAKYAAVITKARLKYIDKIRPIATEIYAGISNEREKFGLEYISAIPDITAELSLTELTDFYLQAIIDVRKEDITYKQTQIGPHREDFQILLSGLQAKSFASQGQQRSCVLALKLSECAVIEQVYGEQPVILLDDVLSELDPMRQEYLLHNIENKQIFITCCDKKQVSQIACKNTFYMQEGILKKDPF